MKTVAICVATYKRPQGLERLLGSLSQLHLDRNSDTAIRVVIVDNDEDQSARGVVQQWKALSPWPVHYDVEPKRGISHARNRLVSLAADSEFIAFIDDDEIADPHWLTELLSAQKRFGSEIVVGPVVPRFEVDPPTWLLKGRFFERKQYREGEFMDYAGTGNALIATRIIREIPNPFDARLALSGGSDTLFFLRLTSCGNKIAFTTKAIVQEFVPPTRMTIGWLCKRAYRGGNTYNICRRLLEESGRWIPKRFLMGLIRIVLGSLFFFPAVLAGRIALVRALTVISEGAGGLAGIVGKKYLEYERIHGS
jgi:glycosyltransferase involved in cell wall biosynthesis